MPTQLRGRKGACKKTRCWWYLPLPPQRLWGTNGQLACLFCWVSFAFATLVTLSALAVDEKDLHQNTRDQIRLLQEEKLARTPIQKKLDSQLVYALRERRQGLAVRGALSLKPVLTVEPDGRVLVDIRARVSPVLLELIRKNGGVVINSFERYDAIRASVPLAVVETVAAQEEVRSIRPAAKATTNESGSSPEGNIAHRATEARNSFHIDGAGIKVGVLSDSVDFLSSAQSAGRLIDVTVLPGQAGSGSGEGTAMLEIVHALAPGSELFFATAFSGEASFAQNIHDLQAAGCRIIVDDVTYFDESPFQDGVIAQAVNDVCSRGSLYFSSAGNSGNQTQNTAGTWEGDFKDGGPATVGRGGRVHDFGGVNYNTVLSGGGFRRVDLFWADPMGHSTNDYDVYVLNSDGAVLRSSTNIQDGNNDPYESIPSLNVGERIVIVKHAGQDRYLHLSTSRGVLSVATSGSTRGHNAAGASNAFSVAAIRVGSPAQPFVAGETNHVESFSSDGPRRIFFNPEGSAITPGNYSSTGGRVLQKPDVTAADGVTTSVPGFTNFFGTSAAAPHAAAVSALLWSYTPFQPATEIRRLLSDTTLDIMAPGFDRDSGAGIAMAYEAVAASPRLMIQTVQLLDGNQNEGLDPNECADVIITLRNTAAPTSQSITGITAVLITSDSNVRVDPAPRVFPDLPPGTGGTSSIPFRVSTSQLFATRPGTNYFLNLVTSNGFSFVLPFQINSQVHFGPTSRFVSTDVPVPIPDLGIGQSTVTVSGIHQSLGIVNVAAYITHTYVSDLRLSLIGPDGTEVKLSANHGEDGQNYGSSCENMTIFADDGATNLASAVAPFLGSFKPDQPLALFTGKTAVAVNGTWALRVEDQASADVGAIQCWSLELTPVDITNGLGQCLFPAQIDVGPTNTVAVSGSTVFLTVTAHGTLPLTYQWFFNEINSLTHATNTTLVLSNVSPADAGRYAVVVANPYGSVTSAPAAVSVLVPPTIACAADRTVILGSSLDFDPPEVTGSNPILRVVSTLTNNGCGNSYSVTRTWMVTNETGHAANCSQKVTVVEAQPPELTVQPQPQVVFLGATANMEVGVSTCPPLFYQWYFNATNSLLDATNATLTLSNVTAAQAGSYRVVVTNAFDSATSAPALLSVLIPAFIVGQPTNTAVIIGQTALLKVVAGGDKPLTFQWYFNGTNSLTEATNATLVLSNAIPAQSGSYAVVVANAYGSVTSSPALLNVVVPPTIACSTGRTVQVGSSWDFDTPTITGSNPVLSVLSTITNDGCGGSYSVTRTWLVTDDTAYHANCSQSLLVIDPQPPIILVEPQPQVVLLGATASLEVGVSNCPPLSYQWYFNKTNSLAEATNATLVLSNTIPAQAGSYLVVVANPYSSVTSTPALLSVVVPPFIVSEPTNTVTTNGQSALFSVTAGGDEPLFYQWYFNATNSLLDATNAILTLSNVTAAQAGSYRVVVTNAFDSVTSAPALLSVLLSPFIISGPTNTVVVNGQTALLNVIVTGDQPLAFEWFFNSSNRIAAATGPNLVLTNVTLQEGGQYSVLVTNPYGSAVSEPADLRVLVTPKVLSIKRTSTIATLSFSTVSNLLYSVYYKDGLSSSNWLLLPKTKVPRLGTGEPLSVQDPNASGTERYYRIRVE